MKAKIERAGLHSRGAYLYQEAHSVNTGDIVVVTPPLDAEEVEALEEDLRDSGQLFGRIKTFGGFVNTENGPGSRHLIESWQGWVRSDWPAPAEHGIQQVNNVVALLGEKAVLASGEEGPATVTINPALAPSLREAFLPGAKALADAVTLGIQTSTSIVKSY